MSAVGAGIDGAGRFGFSPRLSALRAHHFRSRGGAASQGAPLTWLGALGYPALPGPEIAPGGKLVFARTKKPGGRHLRPSGRLWVLSPCGSIPQRLLRALRRSD